jgi:radical SAM protein with 4Fe4S-binding SPASM domain
VLQWHITERCNLRCAHCYQDAYAGAELTHRQLLDILGQYIELLDRWRSKSLTPIFGHVTVTGGEPFARRDFLGLLEVFAALKSRFSFAILTNGTFIDAAMAARLRDLGPRFVQVSMEGTQATHNGIRGPGTFERTVEAITHLVAARVPATISFTAHRRNFREFPEVARLGRRLGVRRVWADRLIPSGSGEALGEQVLTPEETHEFFGLMLQARRDAKRRRFRKGTEVSMHRALQFMVGGGRAYQCGAGDTLITVQPNGDLYPCRRMPIPVGNLLENPLSELYYSAELFRSLRDRNRVSTGCERCPHAARCRGGLKCLSYAMTGNPFHGDPGCWQASTSHAPCLQPAEERRN